MQNATGIYAFLALPLRSVLAASLVFIPVYIGASIPAAAQEAVQGVDEPAVAAMEVVPQQVRYAGKLATRAGETVEVELRIYAAVEGGDPFAVGGPCQHPCWNVSQRERFAAVKPAAP